MTDRAKRGRGPGRPVLENLRNAGPLLMPGEITRTHRVRAPADVQDWWGSLTAERRGDLLARLMVCEDRTRPAVWAAFSGPPAPRAGQGAPAPAEGAPRPAQEQVRLSGAVPPGLSAYALAVVADLQRGGVLVEDGQVYRLTVGGSTRTVRGDTVYGLRRAGVLVTA